MIGRGQGPVAALVTAGAAIALVVLGVLIAVLSGLSGAQLLARGFVGIPVLAIASAASGVAICLSRPRDLIGWLLIASGSSAAVSLASIALLPIAVDRGWAWGAQLALAQLVLMAWTGWLVLVPLLLLVLPSGRFDGVPSRVLGVAMAVAWLVLLVLLLADPGRWTGLTTFGVDAADPLAATPGLGVLARTPLAPLAVELSGWAFAGVAAISLATLAVPVARFVRADSAMRRRLLWALVGAGTVLAVVATQALTALLGPDVGPALVPAVFALIPLGIAVAVMRSDAAGVRRAFGRALSWVLATALVISAFSAIVALLSGLLATTTGAIVAAVTVALVFDPLRRRLQRLADRVTLGEDADAETAMSIIGSELRATDDLGSLLERLRVSLRLSALALRAEDGRPLAASGASARRPVALSLRYAGSEVGILEYVDDEPRLRDIRPTLALLAPVMAGLVRLTTVSRKLAESRGRLVLSTEYERRRLQHDLHDGVSSAVAGIAFALEGIRMGADADTAHRLTAVHGDVLRVAESLREVIDDLAPPELGLLGLDGALRQAVKTPTDAAAPPVVLSIDGAGAALPAAVELAAYRIVLESITNARRHARPDSIDVRIEREPRRLRIEVIDRGTRAARVARPASGGGVGLASMRHRAETLGGAFDAGPTSDGWRVAAVLPVTAHD